MPVDVHQPEEAPSRGAHEREVGDGRLHTREREEEQGVKLVTIAVIGEQVKFLPHFHPPAQTSG